MSKILKQRFAPWIAKISSRRPGIETVPDTHSTDTYSTIPEVLFSFTDV